LTGDQPFPGQTAIEWIPTGEIIDTKKRPAIKSRPLSSNGNVLGVGFLKFGVLFSEPLDPTGRIHQFLFSGEKRVAFGTDFHTYVLFRGTHFNGIPAGTADSCKFVLRMNVALHDV